MSTTLPKTLRTILCGLLLCGSSLLCSAAAIAQTTSDVTVQVGRMASVPINVDADETVYSVLGSDLDAFREYDPDPKKIKLRVIGYNPGTAYVVVASQKGGKLQPQHVVRITIGTPPKPPDPGPQPPGPGPNPPQPGPQPDRELVLEIKMSAQADGWKPADLMKLAEGLKAAELVTKSRGEWKVADLNTAVQSAIRSAVGGPTPLRVRTALGEELNKVLPRDPDKTMTLDELTAARNLFLKLATACEGAAK